MNNTPTSSAVIHDEQARLLHELKKNSNSCDEAKVAINSIITAALAQVNDDSGSETESEKSTQTVKKVNVLVYDRSIESCNNIVPSDVDSSGDEATEKEQFPGLKKLLDKISEGKAVISENMLQKLNELTLAVKANSEVSSNLQERWVDLENSVKEQDKKIERQDQYMKFDNLLLHKFPRPSRNLSSLQFSCFIADQINYFLPALPVPVHWSHISDAHPLRTRSKKSNVIIVRFCNRNIRHEIYDNRYNLTKRGLAITEHLTENNLKILARAKELFGFECVWTEKCNIMVHVNGKTKKVNSIADTNELFETNNTISQPSDLSNSDHRSKHHPPSPIS